MSEEEYKFGWIPSSDEKLALHAEKYAFSLFFPMVYAGAIEYTCPYDNRFVAWYNQDGKNACVGASWSQYMAMVNLLDDEQAYQYDWWKLYSWACDNDKDPGTSPSRDVGTYLWAGGDCLRKVGHWRIIDGQAQPANLVHGIQSYYWIKSADEGRTAFGLKRPLEFGIPWFDGWAKSKLVEKNGEYWLPPRSKWGKVVGGHAICSDAGSDQRGGDRWRNTWGSQYPPVWVSYDDINYLLQKAGGECCAVIDIESEPPQPPPPAEPDYIDVAGTDSTGKKYAGRLTEVR